MLHMVLEDRALPARAKVAPPSSQRERRGSVVPEAFHGTAGRLPETRELPPTREALHLSGVRVRQRKRDVHDIAKASKRLVRPRVDGKHEDMMLGRQRADAGDGDATRLRDIEQLADTWSRHGLDPVQARVDLHWKGQTRRPEGLQMVDRNGEVQFLETGSAQRALCRHRILDEEIKVAERSHLGLRVKAGDLRPLEQDHRPAVHRCDPLQERTGDEIAESRESLFLRERRGDLARGGSVAMDSNDLKAVAHEISSGRLVYQRVETRPHALICSGGHGH